MLCDDVIALKFPDPMRAEAMATIASRIAVAQKIAVSDDAKLMIQTVAEMKPGAMLKALPFMRLPHAPLWLELTLNVTADPETGAKVYEPGPRERFGVLVERIGSIPETWGLTYFANYGSRLAVMPSANVLAFGRDSFTEVATKLFDKTLAEAIAGAEGPAHDSMRESMEIYSDPRDFADFRTLSSSIRKLENPYWGNWHASQIEEGRLDRAVHNERVEVSLRLTRAVPFYVMATILLLNSRHVLKTTDVEIPEKLNRARARSGKRPLLEHKILDIDLARFRRCAGRAGGALTEGAYRAHLVRGHPKVRKTGVFWWSPFWRGNAELGCIHKDYRLTASRTA